MLLQPLPLLSPPQLLPQGRTQKDLNKAIKEAERKERQDEQKAARAEKAQKQKEERKNEVEKQKDTKKVHINCSKVVIGLAALISDVAEGLGEPLANEVAKTVRAPLIQNHKQLTAWYKEADDKMKMKSPDGLTFDPASETFQAVVIATKSGIKAFREMLKSIIRHT